MAKTKILIAEDEPTIANNFKKAFLAKDSKLDITIVGNTNDEKEKLKCNVFNLIIQDLNMPESKRGPKGNDVGLNVIKYCKENQIIKGEPEIFIIIRHKDFMHGAAAGTGISIHRLIEKDSLNEDFYSQTAQKCIDSIKEGPQKNLLKVYDHFPEQMEFIEQIGDAEMISSFTEVLLVLINNNSETPDTKSFTNIFRNIYKESIALLQTKYPDKNLNESPDNIYFYLKNLLKSDVASLYSSLIQTVNAAVHKDQKNPDLKVATPYHKDRFKDHYEQNIYHSLMYGLLSFIKKVDELIKDEEKIELWNKSIPKHEIIEVTISGINPKIGVFAKTENGELGLLHIKHFDYNKKNISDAEVGQKIKVENRGMSDNGKGLDFIFPSNINKNADNVDTDV